MPSFRYQMPPDLAEKAKRNLARTDASVSRFNQQVGSTVSRPPYSGSNPSTAVPPESKPFSFSISGPIDTAIGVPVESFSQPSNTNTTADSTNWRFRSFGGSQLPSRSNGQSDSSWRMAGFQNNLAAPAASPNMSTAYNQQVSPVVTPFNPSGVGTPTASAPVIPPSYKPIDVTDEERQQYGWGL